jgi:hypothetical protein
LRPYARSRSHVSKSFKRQSDIKAAWSQWLSATKEACWKDGRYGFDLGQIYVKREQEEEERPKEKTRRGTKRRRDEAEDEASARVAMNPASLSRYRFEGSFEEERR